MRREQKKGLPDTFAINAMIKHLLRLLIVQLPLNLQAAHRLTRGSYDMFMSSNEPRNSTAFLPDNKHVPHLAFRNIPPIFIRWDLRQEGYRYSGEAHVGIPSRFRDRNVKPFVAS